MKVDSGKQPVDETEGHLRALQTILNDAFSSLKGWKQH